MITWMQRHKKWLVITIWISTIAFVGAGFVGWGSYDYGKQGGVVAKIGDREVTVEEYQQEYSNLYSQYSRMFGDMFNNQIAEQLGLKDIAYNQVLQKNLFMAYGDSLGLDVTDEEIARELLKYEAFFKDGKFDKDTYLKVLNQNRLTPKHFEESLKRTLLLQKVQSLFEVNPTSWEVENISKLLFLEDDITIKILSSNDVKVTVDEEGLKKYWEDNKNSYMSEVTYDLEIKEIPFINSNSTEAEIKEQYEKFKIDYKHEDGKIKSLEEATPQIKTDLNDKFTKTEALKIYLKLKKDEEKFDKTLNILESKLPYSQENIAKIKEVKNGEVVKPFMENGKYIIVKVVKLNPSKVLDFEQAKAKTTQDYEKVLRAQKLQEQAKAELKDFKGTDITGVTRTSKIAGLSQEESTNFLNQLFFATTKEGVIGIGDKIVLYRINSSKIKDYDKTKDQAVKNAIMQLQETELMTNLLQKLENIFNIKSSIQTKE
ncbi:peptidylprolyl isomerase [Aliarcobacter butzleri]